MNEEQTQAVEEQAPSADDPSQSVTEVATDHVPEVADSENEAIMDASKTFVITAIGAVLFCLAALFIILRTRMG